MSRLSRHPPRPSKRQKMNDESRFPLVVGSLAVVGAASAVVTAVIGSRAIGDDTPSVAPSVSVFIAVLGSPVAMALFLVEDRRWIAAGACALVANIGVVVYWIVTFLQAVRGIH